MKRKLIEHIAGILWARDNTTNEEWKARYCDLLLEIERECLPSGSGFDNGTKIDHLKSTPEKIVLITSYHHMNEGGYYNGWTEHTVTVTPSFVFQLNMKVTGRNRNEAKEYIADTFRHVLSEVWERTQDDGFRRIKIEVQ